MTSSDFVVNLYLQELLALQELDQTDLGAISCISLPSLFLLLDAVPY